MSRSSTQFDYLTNLRTSELVCLPFLDTDTSAELPIADEILVGRGYSPTTIRRLRRLARIGLWWQVIAWEWASLDIWDVAAGYGVIAAGIGFFTLLAGITLIDGATPVGVVILIFAAILMVAAALGWRRRGRDHERTTVKETDSAPPS